MQDIAFPAIAALVGLQMLLAINVSRLRFLTNTSVGGSSDPTDPLYKARIAHSNASEFNPALALIILCLHLTQADRGFEWAIGGALVARCLHAISMIVPATMAKPNPLRFLGAAGSYFLGLLMAGRLLLHTLHMG